MERFFEGFELWVNDDLTGLIERDWILSVSDANFQNRFSVVSGSIFGSSKALQKDIGDISQNSIYREVNSPSHYFIGMDVNRLNTFAGDRQFFCSRNSGAKHLQLVVNATNQLVVKLGSAILFTHTLATVIGVANYIEIEHKISTTIGVINLWIDGVLQFSISGDTQGTGINSFVSEIELWDRSARVLDCSIDNFYYLKSDGSTTRLGPIVIENFLPYNLDANNGFTVESGVSEVDATNNTYLSSNTQGVKSSIVNSTLSFDFYSSLSQNPFTVYQVSLVSQINFKDVGKMTIQALVSGTDNIWRPSSVSTVQKSGYDINHMTYEVNPETNAPWDFLSIAGAKFAIKVGV
jgi:hypothetical protein